MFSAIHEHRKQSKDSSPRIALDISGRGRNTPGYVHLEP